MVKRKVEFDAYKLVKRETEVQFTTKGGAEVELVAKKSEKARLT